VWEPDRATGVQVAKEKEPEMTGKERITNGLHEIGAAWAVSTTKYICTRYDCCNVLDGDRPAYHIHPDRSEPRDIYIKRFTSLSAIAEYIATAKRAMATESDEEAMAIWDEYNAS